MPDETETHPAVLQGTVAERWTNAKRRPVVPAWIRDDVTRRAAVKYGALHAAHITAFHVSRSPKYALRTLACSPRGLARTVHRVTWWALDRQTSPLLSDLVTAKDDKGYLRLRKDQAERQRTRLIITGVTIAAAALGMDFLIAFAWALAWAPAAAAVVLLLGYLGRPLDRVWLDVPVVSTQVERLTPDIVLQALGALGIAGINQAMAKGGQAVTFAAPITRDGPGWRADVNLPHGVTAADVVERRDRLASGLRRPLACVWPEAAHEEHAGRLVLWVGDEPLGKGRRPAWPLARTGRADLFRPVPFATDQRSRPVFLLLMFASVLIGAMPRMGKTFALRILALAAALDPAAEIRCFELKGTGDLSCLEHVAHHYGSGADDVTVEECLASLHEVYRDLERRAKVIRGLPKDLCPENKVTPQLSARKSLGLHPVVFIIDECQEAFSHPQHGKAFDQLATGIVKRGPALGIILLLATQRPDKDSLPTGVSANVGIRFCLRVMGQVENDMVLGTSSYRNGLRATTFTIKDKGLGYLAGHSEDAQVVCGYPVDAPAADKIGLRARALREAAGSLTGYAAGEQDKAGPVVSLLGDVASVFAPGEDRLWSEVICARLTELRPGLYGGWDATQLANALGAYEVKTGQVWADGSNRRGVARADLEAAKTG